jgi:hypothetical protein
VQPIDVGINKPFKANMRNIYTEWLLKQDADAAIPSASRLPYRPGFKKHFPPNFFWIPFYQNLPPSDSDAELYDENKSVM